MALSLQKYSQPTIQESVFGQQNQEISTVIPRDIHTVTIEQLDIESGNVKETLKLEGTNLPFQPFVYPLMQDVRKIYYPGGPPMREPTVHVLGTVAEDITITGIFKAKKLRDPDRREDALLISRILERFISEGAPCRMQVGHWIKYVMLTKFTPKYNTNDYIPWELMLMVLGDRNPITGESEKTIEETARKVFETPEDEDISQAVEQFLADIQALNDEAKERYGYDFGQCSGGLLGPAKVFCESYFDFFKSINDMINVVDNFIDKIDRTAFIIQRALAQVENIRTRIYQAQLRLFTTYTDIKRATSIKRQLDAFNVVSLLSSFANTMNLRFKTIEDSVRVEAIVSIRGSHVILEGETLQGISARTYGTSDRWKDIADFNPGVEIEAGNVLLLPN